MMGTREHSPFCCHRERAFAPRSYLVHHFLSVFQNLVDCLPGSGVQDVDNVIVQNIRRGVDGGPVFVVVPLARAFPVRPIGPSIVWAQAGHLCQIQKLAYDFAHDHDPELLASLPRPDFLFGGELGWRMCKMLIDFREKDGIRVFQLVLCLRKASSGKMGTIELV